MFFEICLKLIKEAQTSLVCAVFLTAEAYAFSFFTRAFRINAF